MDYIPSVSVGLPTPKVPLIGTAASASSLLLTTYTTYPNPVKTVSKVSLIHISYFQTPQLPGVGAVPLSRVQHACLGASLPPFLPPSIHLRG